MPWLPLGRQLAALQTVLEVVGASSVDATSSLASPDLGQGRDLTRVPESAFDSSADTNSSFNDLGGAMLLQRIAPELVTGYARYYLREIGQTPASDPLAALVAQFALPETVRDAIHRQLETVLGGI